MNTDTPVTASTKQETVHQQDDGGGSRGEVTTTATTTTTVNVAPGRRRRQKQLSTASLNWNIPANHEVTLHAQTEQGDESWQYQALKFLHGKRVQIFLACLLLLDVLILFCELGLLTLFPTCHIVERDAISCCPIQQEDDHRRWLAEAKGGGHSQDDGHHFCAAGLQAMEEYEAGCDEHKWERVHRAEKALLALTLTILGIFFIELTVTMIALTPQVFFRQVFYALDYFIVTVSLALEITFVQLDEEVLATLIGLVILGRLWRFVRIGHGIYELAEDLAHEREKQLMVYAEELEHLLNQHQIPLPVGELRPSSHGSSDVLERLEKRRRDKKRQSYHQAISGDSH